MSCFTGTIHLGYDNAISWLLTSDREPMADLSSITRAVITIGGTDYDSADIPSLITWTGTTIWRGATYDVLRLPLGGQSIPAGTYTGCRLVIYDATHTNGRVWSDAITVVVQ